MTETTDSQGGTLPSWSWAPLGYAHGLYAIMLNEVSRNLGTLPIVYAADTLVTIGVFAAVITAVAVRLWTHHGLTAPLVLVVGWALSIGTYNLALRLFVEHPGEWVVYHPIEFPNLYGLTLLILAPLVATAAILEARDTIVQELREGTS